MSLTSHEKIGHVGQGCYQDPCEDVCNKSCSWTLENEPIHEQTGTTTPPADHRPTNQVSAWQAGWGSHHARHAQLVADILVKMSGVSACTVTFINVSDKSPLTHTDLQCAAPPNQRSRRTQSWTLSAINR